MQAYSYLHINPKKPDRYTPVPKSLIPPTESKIKE